MYDADLTSLTNVIIVYDLVYILYIKIYFSAKNLFISPYIIIIYFNDFVTYFLFLPSWKCSQVLVSKSLRGQIQYGGQGAPTVFRGGVKTIPACNAAWSGLLHIIDFRHASFILRLDFAACKTGNSKHCLEFPVNNV